MFNKQHHDTVLRKSEQNGGSCLIDWYYSEYPDSDWIFCFSLLRLARLKPSRLPAKTNNRRIPAGIKRKIDYSEIPSWSEEYFPFTPKIAF
jgi:hypothetical protein